MSTVVMPSSAVSEMTATLDARPDDPIGPDRVLRRLEVLRQQLSVRWCGVPGAFAGYDDLVVDQSTALSAGEIRLSAKLVDVGRGTHTVELCATHVGATSDSADAAVPTVLVRGYGKALETRAS